MRNKNDFLNKNMAFAGTFEELLGNYNDLKNRMNDYLSLKRDYDKLLEVPSNEESALSFKDQWDLYCIVHSLSMNDRLGSNISYLHLEREIKNAFPQVDGYDRINQELRTLRESKRRMLSEDVTFDYFGMDCFSERCINRHFLVRLDDELVCISCGATTKDYDLSEEELDFLTLSAERQGFLIKSATKEDLPLLQVLMERQDYYRSLSKPVDPFGELNDSYFEAAEEEYLAQEAEIPELNSQVKLAHLLDSKVYESDEIRIRDPKFLSSERTKALLKEVEAELKLLKNSDSRFKELMIEECKTAKYETLILSGEHIPSLLEQAQDEDDKIALVKAYYNISNQQFRTNSDYFASNNKDWDALSYDCVTANPEINNRILQMKLRRD